MYRHKCAIKAHAAHAAPAHSPDNPGTVVAALPTPRASAPPGATAPASYPGAFELLFPALAVLLQLRACPAPCPTCALPPFPANPAPFTLATEHALMPIPPRLLCPIMLLLSRLAYLSRAGGGNKRFGGGFGGGGGGATETAGTGPRMKGPYACKLGKHDKDTTHELVEEG